MDTRDNKRERIQGIAEGASSAIRLASSSAALFPRRNECPGTHCSLIEQEREGSSCQICHRVSSKRKDGGEDGVARTERESDRRRREEKWPTCWCCRDQQRARAALWRERGGSEREHGEERVDFTVMEGRFQERKGGQARRASLEVEGSMSG